jgi:Asp/Glu/hydantoin racemase
MIMTDQLPDASPVTTREASPATRVRGGRTLYGLELGVIMLDTRFPRLPGDIGHAGTWPFPVAYRIVSGALPERMAQPDVDPELLQPFIDAAQELETFGVSAITTSCGFLAAYQRELSAAASVPVFASPLLQVPVAAALRPGRAIAIFTARTVLGERHFNGAGWSAEDIPVIQVAPRTDSHFFETFVGNAVEADVDRLESEVAELTERAIVDNPSIGAIVLECANFAPFSHIVKRIAGIPVFDLYTLGMHAFQTTTLSSR